MQLKQSPRKKRSKLIFHSGYVANSRTPARPQTPRAFPDPKYYHHGYDTQSAQSMNAQESPALVSTYEYEYEYARVL